MELEGQQENNILRTLVSLYFRAEFAEEIGSKMVMSVDQEMRRRRNAIEPVTRLLVKNAGMLNGWTPALHSAVREVILSYLCYQSIREDLIEELLNSSLSSTRAAMLDALDGLEDVGVGDGVLKAVWKHFQIEDTNGLLSVPQVHGRRLYLWS